MSSAFKGLPFNDTVNRDYILRFIQGDPTIYLSPAPVMVGCKWEKADTVGHIWVLDGYVEYERHYSKSLKKLPNELLLHCIWGFNGIGYNGYYFYNPDTDIIHDSIIGPNKISIGDNAKQIRIYGRIIAPGLKIPKR